MQLQKGGLGNGGCVIASLMLFFVAAASADDWRQWRGENRDGKWSEKNLIRDFENGTLKTVWETEIGSGYSGPTVAAGKVFVMDRQTDPEQTERVLCFDSKTGKELWKHEYDAEYKSVGYVAGPRASVTVDGKRAYSIGTMGHLNCLNVDNGQVVWAKDLNSEYRIVADKRMPIWGIAASPIIFNDLVIVHIGASGGASVVAFNKTDGKEKWRALDDRAQYSSPILHKQNGKDVLICWTGDSVAGIDPAAGNVFWRHGFRPSRMPIGIATPIIKDDHIFVTSFYDGSLMLKMKKGEMAVEKVWSAKGENERATEALHSIISTPIWIDDHIYGVDSYGEFRCLEAKTGKRIWESQKAVPKSRWSTIHFVRNGEDVWMFNERGELILGQLSPKEYKEVSRAKLIEPTRKQLRQRGGVCWSHPAFAERCVFLRNDEKIICVNLAKATTEESGK